MARKDYRWVILDRWAFHETETRQADHWLKTKRHDHAGQPGVQVRKFQRAVRAGGCAVQLIVVVARHQVPIERVEVVACGGAGRHVYEQVAGATCMCPTCGNPTYYSMKFETRDVAPVGA